MSQYDKLDGEIMAAIKHRNGASFSEIELGPPASGTIKELAGAAGRYPYRVLDGRLQALRKRGLIAYSKGKWRMVEGVK